MIPNRIEGATHRLGKPQGKEWAIAIAAGPECPACGEDGFDDWWHDPTCRGGFGIVAIQATLKCHGCGKFFAVTHYGDGETHSSMNRRKAAA